MMASIDSRDIINQEGKEIPNLRRDIDVGIWDDRPFDPHKEERERFRQLLKRKIEPLEKEIDNLKKEISSMKESTSIPEEILKDWDNEEDEIWNDL